MPGKLSTLLNNKPIFDLSAKFQLDKLSTLLDNRAIGAGYNTNNKD